MHIELETTPDGDEYISVHALHELLESTHNANVTIVDVRSEEEYTREHIRGTRNYPLTAGNASGAELEKAAQELGTSGLTILICQSGKRSADAAAIVPDFLEEGSICTMIGVIGGLNAWKEAGYMVKQGVTH